MREQTVARRCLLDELIRYYPAAPRFGPALDRCVGTDHGLSGGLPGVIWQWPSTI